MLLALLLNTACATAPDANQDAESGETPGKITLNEDPELRAIAQRSLEFHKPALQACFDDWLETIDRADYTEDSSLMFMFRVQLDAHNNRTRLIYKSRHREDTRQVRECMETHLRQRLTNKPDATPTTYIQFAITLTDFGTTTLKDASPNTVVTYGTYPDRRESTETRRTQQEPHHYDTSRTREEVVQALRAEQSTLQSCYETQLNSEEGYPLQGITIRSFIILHSSGRIDYIESKSLTDDVDEFLNCVTTSLAGLDFENMGGDEVSGFTLPFVFSPHYSEQTIHLTLSPSH